MNEANRPNLKKILMELGNLLVTTYGFAPPGGRPKNPLSTQQIQDFTEWANQETMVQEALAEMGIDWPVVLPHSHPNVLEWSTNKYPSVREIEIRTGERAGLFFFCTLQCRRRYMDGLKPVAGFSYYKDYLFVPQESMCMNCGIPLD